MNNNQSHHTLTIIKVSNPFTLWHKQIEHLGINYLWKYLLWLRVSYKDNIIAKFYYNTCKLAKVTKQYNPISKSCSEVKFSEIYTDCIKPIIPQDFQSKKYFFAFTNSAIQEIDIFTRLEKWE